MAAGGPGVPPAVEGGLLWQLLRSPDYNLFPKSAVFESNFIQVTKQGMWVDIHNTPTLVTLGVTSSEPCLPLPNVLLIARLAMLGDGPTTQPHQPAVALSRLLPLRYVRLSVQDSGLRLLRVQVATGKVYYLQLRQEHPDAVFALWSRLAEILQRGLSFTPKDPCIHVPHSLVPSMSSSSSSSPTQVHRKARAELSPPGQLAAAPGSGHGPSRLFPFGKLSAWGRSAAQEEESGAPSWSGGNLVMCEWCRGHRPSCTAEEASLKPALKWFDTKRHGLWERDTPAGLLPLSRLSSLVAAGQQ
ncbi:Golgi-associated RAB2 interactor protein 1A [Carettochelys insculpta]|uniref:Golgi-associated RAB2 interactor protein 1A n=1 Tax=Carettochelys insculpta TaxID=44489 RepID=UPI003EB703A8